MTYERLGCCTRWANLFVCCEQCQDEMRFHHGGGEFDVNSAGSLPTNNVIAVGKVPIGGGGCTPTVNIFQIPPGAVPVDEKMAPAAVVEGPTCFGGLYDFCCNTTFYVSTQPGKSGDLATIVKKKPGDCNECCRAVCSTADIYDMHIAEGSVISPTQKALLMGELVHLDFMFFEQDRFPVTCERGVDQKSTIITCLFCLCYCYGCLIPCKASLQLKDNDN